MAADLSATFRRCKSEKRAAFVTYITAGYPTPDDTVPSLLALQEGGADIIELGVPFSDPVADGPVIQESAFVALQHGTNLLQCFSYIKQARAQGLHVPVVLMGYYNPFAAFGEERLMQASVEAKVAGFITVDLPPSEATEFHALCSKYGLSYIPLIAPTTGDARLKRIAALASSFIYVVSTLGVTGARSSVNTELGTLIAKIRAHTDRPLAVGFGVSTREHFVEIGAKADGVVIGSKIISTMKAAPPGGAAAAVRAFAAEITQKKTIENAAAALADDEPPANHPVSHVAPPHPKVEILLKSKFGEFGGQYAPEALVDCLDALEAAYHRTKQDTTFWQEFREHYVYMGRPSSLHLAQRLTEHAQGAQIWLKREDLNHTGSHKINNAMGQILLAKRLGKTRIIAETGAGQHGVATATACAKFGLECVIYMGAEDVRRQSLNVFRIKLLGAQVVAVTSGSQTLKDAVNEAMRDFVANVRTTHYIIGSAIGPHPYPTIVRDFQAVIGRETRAEMLAQIGRLPDCAVACVGGGSNAIGLFHPFIDDLGVRLVGVEAAGDGLDTASHSATLSLGTPGVLHGTKTYLIQDSHGQVLETHSVSAGLDYPAVGPEHAWLKDTKRAEYVAATDAQALQGFRLLSQLEGIIPALESSHAIYQAIEIAKGMTAQEHLVVCVSGRGDKDVVSVAETLPKLGPKIGWDLRFEGHLPT